MSKTLSNKLAVVTGATSGIGEETARRLHDDGATLVLFGRNEAKLAELSKAFSNCTYVPGDVTNMEDLDALMTTVANIGTIDLLVVAAGVANRAHIADIDEQFFDSIVDVNYKGAFFTVQKAIKHLAGGASVVLVSSMAAHSAWPSHSVYSSSKAAVSMLAKNFAADLVKQKIRVNAVSPGYTNTPMYDAVPDKNQYIARTEKTIPLARFATTDEVVSAIVYLLSPAAGYITGMDLVIDGGMSTIYPER